MKKSLIAAAVCATLLLAACANTDVYGGNVYTGEQAKEARNISYGTIVSVRPVQIQAESQGVVGTLGGGAIGGIAGAGIGGGRGSDIMSAVGATAGALFGSWLEHKANKTAALEIVVRKDSGEEIVVMQKREKGFEAGKRVRIVGNASSLNVSLVE